MNVDDAKTHDAYAYIPNANWVIWAVGPVIYLFSTCYLSFLDVIY